MYGLAMHNPGSISTQALGGVISTTTYGTRVEFKVLPGEVMVLTVLQTASSSLTRTTSRVPPSMPRSGLRCTGLIVTVQLSLEPAFRCKKWSRLTTWSTISIQSSRDPSTCAFGGTRGVSSADRTVKVQVRPRF